MTADFDDVADSEHGDGHPALDPDEIQPVTTRHPEAEADSYDPPSSGTSRTSRIASGDRSNSERQPEREPSIKLELAPTSNFPESTFITAVGTP